MYNDKIKASIYKYMETHKEQVASYKREYNKKYYAEQYANDPEFREKEQTRHRNSRKERYANDPEFRAKVNEKRKALYHKKKNELLANVTANALPVLSVMVEATA